ncbi:MAG: hypothetical protein JF593_14270 [Novosphingobium sp.]|nr:hypothetical protein [Novosphingobium sp.]
MDSEPVLIALAALIGLTILASASLTAWRDWLALRGRELDRTPREIEGVATAGMARIEIADLKERIRNLEAIAAGVDL